MPTYDRPVEATLHVHLANGETFEAGPADLAKFGLVKPRDAYLAFADHLRGLLQGANLIGRDLTDARLNPVRYLVDLAINNPNLLDDVADTDAQVVEIERFLSRRKEMAELAGTWRRHAGQLRLRAATASSLEVSKLLADEAGTWDKAAQDLEDQIGPEAAE